MKKIIVFTSLIFLFQFTLFCQSKKEKAKPLSLKLHIGPTLNYGFGSMDLSNNRAFRGANLSAINQISGGLVVSFLQKKKFFFSLKHFMNS